MARRPRDDDSARPETPSDENSWSRSSSVVKPLTFIFDVTVTTMSVTSGSASAMALLTTIDASIGVRRRLRATSAWKMRASPPGPPTRTSTGIIVVRASRSPMMQAWRSCTSVPTSCSGDDILNDCDRLGRNAWISASTIGR